MRTIIFDVDDTLYDQASSFHRTVRKLISDSFTYEQLDAIFRASRKYSERLFDLSEAGKITKEEWQIGRMKLALHDFNITLTDKEAETFHDHYVKEQGVIELFPEVQLLLQELHTAGYRLGILTNGEESHQQMKIDQLNLEKWIKPEYTFISGSYGCAKPVKKIFEIVEEHLQCESNDILYVGDSYEKDVIGAKSAGWQVIWMNHRNKTVPDEVSYFPDEEVHSAKELYQLLKSSLIK